MTYPALERAVLYALKARLAIPEQLLSDALKTVDFYDRSMWHLTLQVYRGEIGTLEFETSMIDLIQQQLTRAWNEGMRQLGLDPETDQTPEGDMEIQNLMTAELDFVGGFAADVDQARLTGGDIAPFHARVDIWTNRYNEVVNDAVAFYSDLGQKLMWQYGDTDVHCDTCSKLDGVVAFASEWDQSGFKPQNPPNDMLTCGGWRCGCTLLPTDQRRSPRALETLMNIAGGA